jgi:hypothetical protein
MFGGARNNIDGGARSAGVTFAWDGETLPKNKIPDGFTEATFKQLARNWWAGDVSLKNQLVDLLLANGWDRNSFATFSGVPLQSIADFMGYNAPRFAMGGLHTGGMRLVGEEGPELEVTGPARYYSADQTMAMLRDPHRANDALVAEVRQLRAQVAELQSAMVATATNTGKTARQLDRWDGEGLPTERT